MHSHASFRVFRLLASPLRDDLRLSLSEVSALRNISPKDAFSFADCSLSLASISRFLTSYER